MADLARQSKHYATDHTYYHHDDSDHDSNHGVHRQRNTRDQRPEDSEDGEEPCGGCVSVVLGGVLLGNSIPSG